MSYQKKISTAHPGLVVFALDNSSSTLDALPGTDVPVFKWISRLTGVMLKDLVNRCTETVGDQVSIKRRYYIYIIIYGSQATIWGEGIMPIDDVIQKYIDDGNSLGLNAQGGGTYAEAAMQCGYDFLREAVVDPRFANSFPPLVFHITDGKSATDPTPVAKQIMDLATADGHILVSNVYIGTQTSLNYSDPDDFPGYVTEEDAGPNEDNLRLFRSSSMIPDTMHQNMIEDGIFPNLKAGSHLFFDVRTKGMLAHAIQTVGSIGSRQERLER